MGGDLNGRSNSLPTFYHSIDTMSNIPFADIFKQHTVGVTDPYWRTIELQKAIDAKWLKESNGGYRIPRQRAFKLLRNLSNNLQVTELSSERFPK